MRASSTASGRRSSGRFDAEKSSGAGGSGNLRCASCARTSASERTYASPCGPVAGAASKCTSSTIAPSPIAGARLHSTRASPGFGSGANSRPARCCHRLSSIAPTAAAWAWPSWSAGTRPAAETAAPGVPEPSIQKCSRSPLDPSTRASADQPQSFASGTTSFARTVAPSSSGAALQPDAISAV
ncbi:MAG: hypothetical protein R3F34_05950 [Planctomycetota bacterium]